jgi:hypothetical protein
MQYGKLPTHKLESGETINGFKFEIPYPHKTAIVRWPTADELSTYMKTAEKVAKENKKKSDDDEYQLEIDLLKKIRLDSGEDFNGDESVRVINRLTDTGLVSCEKDGDAYEIVLSHTACEDTKHRLRMPTFKELANYRKAPGISAAVKTYQQLVEKSSGYDPYFKDDVPPTHKYIALMAVLTVHNAIDILISPN